MSLSSSACGILHGAILHLELFGLPLSMKTRSWDPRMCPDSRNGGKEEKGREGGKKRRE